MLRARKIENGIRVFNPKENAGYNFSETTWEILKVLKKHGQKDSVKKIMELFGIDEQNAKEDIQTVLTNLKTLGLKLEDLPENVSDAKYAPRVAQLDVTQRCNSKCIYCFSQQRLNDQTELSTEQIIDTINDLSTLETWVLVISGGEPFLRKDILKIIEHADKLQISIWIYTNAILIDEKIAKKLFEFKNINKIQVSFDSCIKEHYEMNRGAKDSFEKTINGIKNLIKNGISPEIEMVVTRNNIDDIGQTMAFLNDIGVKKVHIGPAVFGGRAIENKERINLTREQLKGLSEKILEVAEKYYDSMLIQRKNFMEGLNLSDNMYKCGLIPKSTLFITSNGTIYPCLFLNDKKYVIGDIKKEPLYQIWNSSEFLKKIRNNTLNEPEECKNCDIRNLFQSMSQSKKCI